MDQSTAYHLAQQYAREVQKDMKPEAIVLYGSFAKGNFRDDSDIDVAVVFKGFQGDVFKTSARLWKLCRNISEDIEPILLDSDDDKSGFVTHVMRTGRVLYQAQAA